MKNVLLIIDPQNDFCLPTGSLYVKGADKDMERLASFILKNIEHIDEIHVSRDMHNYDDIAHARYWKNFNGELPKPFTNITVDDMKNGIWTTAKEEDYEIALKYLQTLKDKNKFTHTIWPDHCVHGTTGFQLFPALNDVLNIWEGKTEKSYIVYVKGMNRNTEHFGMFQTEDDSEEFNEQAFRNIFSKADNVFVSGEAKSHCVATSLQQIMERDSEMISKITLLTDATSDVEGLGHLASPIYKKLRAKGMKENTTIEITLD